MGDELKSRRSTRLLFSILSGLGGQFIALLAPILVLPAMLLYLGHVTFGVWVTAVSVSSLVLYLDFGVGQSLVTQLSNAFGSNNRVMAQRLISNGYFILLSVMAISFLFCIVAIFNKDLFENSDGFNITIAMLLVCFMSLPIGIIQHIFQAHQRIPLYSLLQAVSAIGSVCGSYLLISFSASPWVVVIVYAGVPVAVMFTATIWYFGQNHDLAPRIADATWPDIRQLLAHGSQYFAIALMTGLSMNIDTVIISLKSGPEAVADFAFPMRLGSVLGIIVIRLFIPLWSFNGEALARGDLVWVRRNTLIMSILGGAMVLISGLVLLTCSNWIMQVWVGRQFEGQMLVLASLVLVAVVMAFTAPWNMVLNAQGITRHLLWPWITMLLVSVVLKLMLVDDGRAWLSPAITAVCYLTIISPVVFISARRELL